MDLTHVHTCTVSPPPQVTGMRSTFLINPPNCALSPQQTPILLGPMCITCIAHISKTKRIFITPNHSIQNVLKKTTEYAAFNYFFIYVHQCRFFFNMSRDVEVVHISIKNYKLIVAQYYPKAISVHRNVSANQYGNCGLIVSDT